MNFLFRVQRGNNSHLPEFQKRYFIFLLFAAGFLFCQKGVAQTAKGYLMIAVKPDGAIIRLDTTRIDQIKSHFPLDTGMHVIQAWAPGRKLVVDTLFISENSGVLFRKKLTYTDEFKEYRRKKQLYMVSKTATGYIPAIITAGLAISYWLRHDLAVKDADDYLAKANESKGIYENLTDESAIEEYQAWYYYYKDKYDYSVDHANNISKKAAIVIPVSVAATGILFYVSTRLVKPVFNEQPLLSGLGFNYQLLGESAGPRLTYQLKF